TFPQLIARASRGEAAEQAVITLVGKHLPPGATVQSFAVESARTQGELRNIRWQGQVIDGWSGYRVLLGATPAASKGRPAAGRGGGAPQAGAPSKDRLIVRKLF